MRAGRVDEAIDALNATMVCLRRSIRGIPIHEGTFRGLHDEVARGVAGVVVMLETQRGKRGS